MKVLITGAGGQLGTHLAAVCTAAGDDVIAADRASLDVTDRDQAVGCVTSMQPDVVIAAGAWTAVDACEADAGRAFAVNALGVRHLAEGSRLAGAHLLYVSTDYVFDGTLDRPYHEWDVTGPISVYGASKLAGEHEAITGCPGAAVVRTSTVIGPHGSNILKTILRLAADPAQKLAFVADNVGNVAFTGDLAGLMRRLAVARLPGTFHATNQGSVTWFDFARTVLEAAGHDPDRVSPIAAADLDRPAARPANGRLTSLALPGVGIDLLPDFHDPLARAIKELT